MFVQHRDEFGDVIPCGVGARFAPVSPPPACRECWDWGGAWDDDPDKPPRWSACHCPASTTVPDGHKRVLECAG